MGRQPGGSGQAPQGPQVAGRKTPASKTSGNVAPYMLLALVIAAALLLTLLRSADRGQVIFALLASFFLATLIAHQVFPNNRGALAWVLPVVLAVASYALGSASALGKPPQGWIEVSYYAQVLPIDWLTAGAGGAMAGYWVSLRIFEAQRIDRLEQAGKA